jgi:hypothetical protein
MIQLLDLRPTFFQRVRCGNSEFILDLTVCYMRVGGEVEIRSGLTAN